MSENRLQREAEKTSYTLRSSFFYRVHSLWPNLLQMAASAWKLAADWQDQHRLGISEIAWKRTADLRIEPALVFCHLEVIKAMPPLIAYYRCLALLPQKGTQRLAYSSKAFEEGKKTKMSEDRADKFSRVFNGLISLLIESDPKWSLEKNRTAALLNLGTQINGSWRDQIGKEGGRRVKELLITYFAQLGLIKAALSANGSQLSPEKLAAGSEMPLTELKFFTTLSGYTITFGRRL